MTDAEYHAAMRRIRRGHWLHYPVQALVMGGVVLATLGRIAGPGAANPRLATWPALLLALALLPLLSLALYAIAQYMRPNLRRPYAENMRLYQSRLLLRNSLLGLLGLPLLAAYLLTRQPLALLACAALLGLLAWRTAPTAKKYQRWLIR